MKKFKTKINLDKIGFSASVLCAIHCAFLPVLITLLPVLGIGFMLNDWVERLMIGVSFLIAGFSFGSSYKLHQKPLPILLLLAGISLIMIAHLILSPDLEPFVLPAGGLIIATAHYFNWRYIGACNHEHSTISTAIK